MFGPALEAGPQSSENITFSVETCDTNGDLWTSAEDVRVVVKDPVGRNVRCKVFHVKQALYQVSFVRAISGIYKIDVSINSGSIEGSPFSVTVSQVVAPRNCIAKGSSLTDGKQSEGLSVFSVELRDMVGDDFEGKCRLDIDMKVSRLFLRRDLVFKREKKKKK